MAGKLFDPRILEPAGTNGFGIQLFPPKSVPLLGVPFMVEPLRIVLPNLVEFVSHPDGYICQQEERNLKLIYSIVARARLRYGLFILNGLVYLDYLMAISLSVLRVGDVCSLHQNQRRLLALFYTFVLCGKSGIQEREQNFSHKNPTWNVSLLESMLSFWI